MKKYYIDDNGKLHSVTAQKITANYIYHKKAVLPVRFAMYKTPKIAKKAYLRDVRELYESMKERHQEEEKKMLRRLRKAEKLNS